MKDRKHRLCLTFRVGESYTKVYLLVQLDHLQEVVDDELLMGSFHGLGRERDERFFSLSLLTVLNFFPS